MLTPDAVVALTAEALSVTRPGPEGPEEIFSCDLGEFAEVRRAAGQVVLALAEAVPQATSHVCSRCGVCCRRPHIEVTAQDVFRMARRLGFAHDEEFRTTYLAPSDSTWNAAHAELQHTADGSCVFLQVEAGGHTTRCTIYEDRPQSCIDFSPDQPGCIKQSAKLIQHLKRIEVDARRVRVTNDQDRTVDISDRPESFRRAWKALEKALQEIQQDLRQRYVEGLAEVQSRIEALEAAPRQHSIQETLSTLSVLRKSLATLEELAERMGADEYVLTDLEERRTALERALAGAVRESTEPLLPAGLTGLLVNAAGVILTWPDRSRELAWPAWPAGRGLVQRVMQSLVTWDRPDLQAALKEAQPPCFQCGECCRVYSVEIHPYDIERLANHLALREDQVVRKYTEKPLFGWNPHNRVLKKKKMSDGRPGCMFLEQRPDGFFYCSVHAFKPDVCRQYQPTNILCQKSNQIKHWPRMIDNLAWLLVGPQELMVATKQRIAEAKPPLQLTPAHHPPLETALLALTASLPFTGP
ncbi:MAG TPA: YkgJ family cysteine cluster protein [Candidatus Xenobia bacterium]|jgi:Fe-S-cluster containining protein